MLPVKLKISAKNSPKLKSRYQKVPLKLYEGVGKKQRK